MPFAAALKYLAGYPDQLVHPIRDLLADGRLGGLLVDKYPEAHAVRDDAALYASGGVGTHARTGSVGAAGLSPVSMVYGWHLLHPHPQPPIPLRSTYA